MADEGIGIDEDVRIAGVDDVDEPSVCSMDEDSCFRFFFFSFLEGLGSTPCSSSPSVLRFRFFCFFSDCPASAVGTGSVMNYINFKVGRLTGHIYLYCYIVALEFLVLYFLPSVYCCRINVWPYLVQCMRHINWQHTNDFVFLPIVLLVR